MGHVNQYIIRFIITLASFTTSYSSLTQFVEQNDPYIFLTGEESLYRMDSQNQLLFEKSREHLNAANLKAGQVVWDVGCGHGTMTLYLARTVGKTGHVYALDKSKDQIDYARVRIQAVGLGNVTFIQTDITAPDKLPPVKPDLIYMRHVLMHVRRPENVVQFFKQFLNQDSAIVIQEPIIGTAMSSINDNVINEYLNTLVMLGEKLGVDYDIGYRLKVMFRDVGFTRIQDDFNQPHVKLTAAIQPLILGLNEWGDKALQLGLTTPDKINQWVSTITNWNNSDNSFYAIPEQIYIIAYK